jgi:hypothetical protein
MDHYHRRKHGDLEIRAVGQNIIWQPHRRTSLVLWIRERRANQPGGRKSVERRHLAHQRASIDLDRQLGFQRLVRQCGFIEVAHAAKSISDTGTAGFQFHASS